jgi:hypothetical protein
MAYAPASFHAPALHYRARDLLCPCGAGRHSYSLKRIFSMLYSPLSMDPTGHTLIVLVSHLIAVTKL